MERYRENGNKKQQCWLFSEGQGYGTQATNLAGIEEEKHPT